MCVRSSAWLLCLCSQPSELEAAPLWRVLTPASTFLKLFDERLRSNMVWSFILVSPMETKLQVFAIAVACWLFVRHVRPFVSFLVVPAVGILWLDG